MNSFNPVCGATWMEPVTSLAWIAGATSKIRLGIGVLHQSFTRPYTPQTNGKAERFIQTMKRRWAYRYVFRTSAMRAAS